MGWIITVILVGLMFVVIRYQTKKEPPSLHMLYTQTTHKPERIEPSVKEETKVEKKQEKKEKSKQEEHVSVSPIRMFLQDVEEKGLTKEEIEQSIEHKEMKEVILAYHQLVQTKHESHEENVQEWIDEMEEKLNRFDVSETKEKK